MHVAWPISNENIKYSFPYTALYFFYNVSKHELFNKWNQKTKVGILYPYSIQKWIQIGQFLSRTKIKGREIDEYYPFFLFFLVIKVRLI